MQSLLLRALVFTAALPAAALALVPGVPDYFPEAEEIGPLTESRHIGIGMKRETVVTAMQGQPDEKLTADIWVYWRFKGPPGGRFETLIVTFARDRVAHYKLVAEKDARFLVAQVRAERERVARAALARQSALRASGVTQ